MRDEPMRSGERDEFAAWGRENERLWKVLRYGGMALLWPLAAFAYFGRDWPRMLVVVVSGFFLVVLMVWVVGTSVWTVRLYRRRWLLTRHRRG